jgi:fibronectin-binding autotransporter adhesin
MITSGICGRVFRVSRIHQAIFTSAVICLLCAAEVAKAQNSTAGVIQQQPNGTVVVYGPTGSGPTATNPIVTTILAQGGGTVINGLSYNNWAFLVNDGTASIDVFGPLTGTGYTPTVGDSLTITGAYLPFNQIPELGGTNPANLPSIAINSQNNSLPGGPLVRTIPQLNQTTLPLGKDTNGGIGGYVVQLNNVTISGVQNNDTVFGTNQRSATVTDSDQNSMVMFYDPRNYSIANTNLFGQTIPTTGPVNITGFVQVFGGNTPEIVPFVITALPPAGQVYWNPDGKFCGPGTWDTTSALWNSTPDHTSQPAPFTSANYATFSRTSGTDPIAVTVDAGGVTTNGAEFDSNGYVISGPGVLTLGQSSGNIINTIKVANATDTATINAKISGSAGLTKTGNGTLILGSAASDFTGGVTLSKGTLQIASDANLGDASNGVALNGGTLKFSDPANPSTYSTARSISGVGGSLDVGIGHTLTINGSIDMTGALILATQETLSVQNSTRNLGGVTFNTAPATLSQLTVGSLPSDTVVMKGNITTAVAPGSTGTAQINGGVNFQPLTQSTTSHTISVAVGTTLVITGNVSDTKTVNLVTGGTIDMQGDNTGVQHTGTSSAGNPEAAFSIGSVGNAGPIVKVYQRAGSMNTLGSSGNGFLLTNFLNSGTMSAQDNVVYGTAPLVNGNRTGIEWSIGSTNSSPFVFGGAVGKTIELQGRVNLFKPTPNSGQTVLTNVFTVTNNTTFSGGWAPSTGSDTNTGALTINGAGTLTLSTDSAVNIAMDPNAAIALDAPVTVDTATVNVNNPMTNSLATFTVVNNGKVRIGVNNALNTGATLTLGNSSNTIGTFDLNGFTQTLASLKTTGTGASIITNDKPNAGNPATLIVAGGTNTFAGIIQDHSSSPAGLPNTTALTITGGAAETLSGANTYTGTTTVSNGTLTVTGTAFASASLQLGGGGPSSTFVLNKAGTTVNFSSGTTLNAGASQITDTGTIGLGLISRNPGSTANFTLTVSNVTSGSGSASTILTDSSVAYATVGNDWAAKNAGNTNIVALPAGSYTGSTSTTLAGNADIVTGANGQVTLGGDTSITSLRYNVNDAAHTVDLGGSTLTTGGILVGSGNSTAANTLTISNGSIKTAGAGKDLVVIHNGAAPMTISANVVDNGTSGLTKSGTGNLILTGTSNSYSGPTNVDAGTLTLSAASAVSAGTTFLNGGALSVNNASAIPAAGTLTFKGGTLQYTSASAAVDYAGQIHNSTSPITIDANNLTTPAFNSSPDSSNTGGLTKAGTGTFTLNGNDAVAWTGPVTITGGTLSLGTTGRLPASSKITFTGTGTVGFLQYTAATAADVDFSTRIVNSTAAIGIDTNGQSVTLGGTTAPFTAIVGGPSSATPNSGGLTLNDTAAVKGTLTLTGINSFTGPVTVTAGTLLLGANSALAGATVNPPTAAGASIVFAQAGSLHVTASLPYNFGDLSDPTGGGSAGDLTLVDNAGNAISISVGNAEGSSTISTYSGKLIDGNPGGMTHSSLTKVGSGTLVLSGNNSYQGTTTTTSLTSIGSTTIGTLRFAKKVALYGADTTKWTANNIIAQTNSNLAFNVGGAGEFLADDITLIGALGSATGGFQSNAALGLDTTNAGGTFTYPSAAHPGDILANPNAGNNILALTKLGTGTLELTSANTLSGTTRLTVGGIKISNRLALQNSTVTMSASTTLTFNGGLGSSPANPIVLGGLSTASTTLNLSLLDTAGTPLPVTLSVGSNNASNTFAGILSGTGGNLIKAGTGTETLSGTNTYTGTTTVTGGTLLFTKPRALYTADSLWTTGNIDVKSGATLAVQLGGTGDFSAAQLATLVGLGSATGGLEDGALFGISTANATTNSTTTYGTVITDTNGGSNHIGITKLGASTLSLTAANTYTGPTTIATGGLLLGNANAVQNSTVIDNVSNVTSTNATSGLTATTGLTFASGQGGIFTLGSLAGSGNFALQDNTTPTPLAVTVKAGGNNAASTTYIGVISGPGNFEKTGSGTLNLLGTNTYTGTTTVSGTGTLVDGIPNGLSTTSLVTLAGGTLSTAGFSQDFTAGPVPAPLKVTASSNLDLGAATSPASVKFADSHLQAWTGGAVLTVKNWTYLTDHLFVGTSGTPLTQPQLNSITFADFHAGASLSTDECNYGELTPRIGDIDQNGTVDVADVSALGLALTDVRAYQQTYFSTAVDPVNDVKFILDANGDGSNNNLDLQAQINLLANGGGFPAPGGGSVTAVPEPTSFVLLGLGGVMFALRRVRRSPA